VTILVVSGAASTADRDAAVGEAIERAAAPSETSTADAVRAADTVDAATSVIQTSEPALVVLDLETVRDGCELVRAVRTSTVDDPRLPFVLLSEAGDACENWTLAVDEQCRLPVRPDGLAGAIERALSVRSYQNAIESFYEECRQRAQEAGSDPFETSERLEAARERADASLANLPDRSAVAPALVWTPDAEVDAIEGSSGEPEC